MEQILFRVTHMDKMSYIYSKNKTIDMQKYFILTVIFSYVALSGFSQMNYETKKYPVSNYIFWPEKGVLMYGEDPNGQTLLKECTMVNGEPKPLWNKTIMPLIDQPDVIYSHSSDYLYFLDKVSSNIGKLSFNQFHKAGTLRKKNMSLNQEFFKLGKNIDMSNLVIAAAGTTENFLVVLFEYYEGSTSEYKYAVALIKHVTFKMEMFWVPELVITKNELNSGFKGALRILGDINGSMILSQPEATEKFTGKNHFSFNSDGQFEKRKQVEWPEKGKYPLMAYDIDLIDGNIVSGNLAIDFKNTPNLSHQGGEKIINNHKYAYGFYSEEKPEGKNPDRKGVYAIKYTGSGDVVWKKFMPFEGVLLEDKKLISKNTTLGQSLVFDEGLLSLSFGYDDQIHNVVLEDSKGEVKHKIEPIKGVTLENLNKRKYHIYLQRLDKKVSYNQDLQKIKGKWYASETTDKNEAAFVPVK